VTGSPRVFLLGAYFIVAFTNVISAVSHLQYIAISTANPALVTANQDLAAAYISATTLSWDGVVFNGNLYVAYNTTTGGQAVKVTYLSVSAAATGATPVTPTTFTGYKSTLMTICADATASQPLIYVSFYDLSATKGYVSALDVNINVVMNPVKAIPSGTILNLASAAQNGICSLFYEISNNYSYDSAIASNYINGITVKPGPSFNSVFSTASSSITASSATGLVNGMYLVDNTTAANIAAGTTFTVSGTTLTLSINTAGNSASNPGDAMSTATLSTAVTIIRSVGLASKAFINNGSIYFLTAFSSPFQPSYFMVNGSTSLSSAPVIVGKLAYENGGGYCTLGLPGVSQTGTSAQVSYLYKDLISSLSTANNTQQTTTGGIYSQTGVNLGTFNFTSANIDTAEIGKNLHLSGGFLGMYDGYLPVEHNFFLWPDSVEVTTSAVAVTPTGTVTSGSPTITALSSMAGIGVGASVTGTAIPGSTTIIAVTATTATMSANATGTHVAETITITGNIDVAQAYYYQAIYEWADNQGNIHRSAGSIPVTVTTTGTTSTNTVTLPMLRMTMKTANPVKIVIYRWGAASANQVYYQITSVTAPMVNDTTADVLTFYDCQTNASIGGNSIIYTNGGILEDENAPASNIMTLFDTRLWIVDAEDPSLLWFSKQVIEAVPAEMSAALTYFVPPNVGTTQTTGPITAIAPMDDKLVIFKGNSLLYINGAGPDNLGNNNQYSQPIFITSTVGCVNQSSIVLMNDGIMFQSDKGIWLLNRGLSVSYIGAPVEAFNASMVNSANNIPATNQVRSTLSTGQTLMYDYYFSQWGTFGGCPAISSCIYGGEHTYINGTGATFQETPGIYLDGSNPVLMSFVTGWINLAALQGFERFYHLYLLGQFLSPIKLQIQIAYDYISQPVQSVIITPTNYSPATTSPFGDFPAPFGSPSNVMQWRIDAKYQKCQAFQISLNEVYDSTQGAPAGAGFTLSGMNLMVSIKRGSRPIRAANQAGRS
jgi:hypothetical protein